MPTSDWTQELAQKAQHSHGLSKALDIEADIAASKAASSKADLERLTALQEQLQKAAQVRLFLLAFRGGFSLVSCSSTQSHG